MTLRERLDQKIHAQDIRNLATAVAHEQGQALLEETCRLLTDADKRTADNAAWLLTHLDKESRQWLCGKQAELIREAMHTSSTTKRRLILTVLERQPFAADDISTDFLDCCLEQLQRPDLPPGLRSVSAKLAWKQCRHYPELIQELHAILSHLDREALTPAMQCVRRNIIRQQHPAR